MRKIFTGMFNMGLCFVTTAALAGTHPDILHQTIDGKPYSCQPAQSVTYCPPHDVLNGIYDNLEARNCVDELIKDPAQVSTETVSNCFKTPHLKYRFDQLQLMGISMACLAEKKNDCAEVKPCNSNSPEGEQCGHLGSFLEYLKARDITVFRKIDGEAACSSLLY